MTVTPYTGTQWILLFTVHLHIWICSTATAQSLLLRTMLSTGICSYIAIYCDNIRQTCCLHLQGSRQQPPASNGTCFYLMLITCCAYSCTQYGLHTQYMLLSCTDGLLCLQQNHYGLFLFILPRFSFGSPQSVPANTAQHPTTLPIFCMSVHERLWFYTQF